MHDMLRRLTWTLIIGIAGLVLLFIAFGRFSLEWKSLTIPAGATIGLVMLACRYRQRADKRIANTLEALAQVIAFTAAGALMSYLFASWGGALWDARLQAADAALGLEWRAYLDFVNARPWLGQMLGIAYASLLPQTILTVLVLGFSGRALALYTFVAATVFTGVACIAISAAMPAMAYYVHLGLTPSDYQNLAPAAAFVHVAHLEALRSGAMTTLSLANAEGIITFPSYHAALAVIFAASLWTVPKVRYVGLSLNAAMLAATPIDGGHYFVDVIAGVIVAIAALWVIKAPFGWSRMARHVPALAGGLPRNPA